MILFGSVCITDTEVWIEERKYIQHCGALHEIRGDKRGPKTKHKEDQQLFTETLAEIKRVLALCGPKERKRTVRTEAVQTEEVCPRPTIEVPPTPPPSLSLTPTPSLVPSFRPLVSARLFGTLPSSSLLRSFLYPMLYPRATFVDKHQ
jgi:hypothetical protein